MGKAGKVPGSQTPQAVKQFRVQSAAWGGVRPLIYGEPRIAGNIISAWHFVSKKVTGGLGSISSGKAAGGLGSFQQYNYFIAIVLSLGEGGPSIANLLWSTTDAFDIGLATPGEQAVSIGPKGKENIQPLTGIEPGGYKAKRVLVLGEDDLRSDGYKWHHAAWRAFPSDRFVQSLGELITDALEAGSDIADEYATDFGEVHKGTATMVAAKLSLGSTAGMANWNFPARLLCSTSDVYGYDLENGGGRDADPATIWLDILCNPKHGVGWWDGDPAHDTLVRALPDWPASWVAGLDGPHPWGAGCTGATTPTIGDRADSWSAACRANDILLALALDTQSPAADVLKNLAEVSQTAVVFSEGLLKMIPYADVAYTSPRTGVTFTPTDDPTALTTGANIAARYDLTIDDFLPGANKDPVEIERKSVVPDHGSAGLFNDVRVEFQHRMNGFSTEVAQAKDEASINAVGLLSAPTFTYHEVTDPNLALDTAVRHLQRLVSVRNIYRFTLGWRFGRLEPMDVVTLPGEALAIPLTGQRIGVRLTSTSEDKNGAIAIEAEEFPRAFPSRAPEETPTPPTELDPPTDGVIVGMNGCDQSSSANPQYFSLTGELLSADRISGVAVASGIPAQANHAFPPGVDIVITAISVHAWYFFPLDKASVGTMRFVFNDLVQKEPTDMVLYWNADRVSSTGDITEWTGAPDLNKTQIWRGRMAVPASAVPDLCFRVAWGGDDAPINALDFEPSRYSFAWQIEWEVDES